MCTVYKGYGVLGYTDLIALLSWCLFEFRVLTGSKLNTIVRRTTWFQLTWPWLCVYCTLYFFLLFIFRPNCISILFLLLRNIHIGSLFLFIHWMNIFRMQDDERKVVCLAGKLSATELSGAEKMKFGSFKKMHRTKKLRIWCEHGLKQTKHCTMNARHEWEKEMIKRW